MAAARDRGAEIAVAVDDEASGLDRDAVARRHVGRQAIDRRLGADLVAQLTPLYFAGVAMVAGLLVYEQSLVSEHDLSQVKRAFDLNGYVGILYLVTTSLAVYLR